MKHALRIGSAWKTPTAGKPGKYHFGVKLDVGGMLPALKVRIVEVAEKKSSAAPDLVVLFTPPGAGGDDADRQVGALWKYDDYFIGRLTPQRLGLVRCAGGATIDFGLVAEEIGIKLCALKEPREKGPTHILLRMTPKKKADEASGERPAAAVPVGVPEDLEEVSEEEDDVPF